MQDNCASSLISIISKLLGDELCSLLLEGKLDEVMLNPNGFLFVTAIGGKNSFYGTVDSSKATIAIRQLSNFSGKTIDEKSPIVECELSKLNIRFEAILPPLVKGPVFCMRSMHALNLDFRDLVASNFIKESQIELFDSFIKEKKNILICGMTGTGKTSFINSFLKRICALDTDSRITTIEDTPELKLEAENSVSLFTNETTSISNLVKASLRLSPMRIVIGEVRSVEALDMIDALTTGHSGCLASIHAGTVTQCLERLKLLVTRAQSTYQNIESMIAQAIDVVIVLKKNPYRHVSQIALVKGFENSQYNLQFLGE